MFGGVSLNAILVVSIYGQLKYRKNVLHLPKMFIEGFIKNVYYWKDFLLVT